MSNLFTDLCEESLYIKNIINSDTNKDEIIDINEILKTTYETLKISIPYEEYINFLTNVSKNYKTIKFTKENINIYVLLVDCFMFDNKDKILNYICETYAMYGDCYGHRYYEQLCTHNFINEIILKKIEKEPLISNNCLKYIMQTNPQICNKITKLHSKFINQELLNKCMFITDLDLRDNIYVTSVNHLNNLEKLNISWNTGLNPNGTAICGVNQEGISKLTTVKILHACLNEKIKDVNHLEKLEELHIAQYKTKEEIKKSGGSNGVKQEGISKLKLIKILNANFNDKITDVNHLENLEELHATDECGVTQEGISKLSQIKILNAMNNNKITDVNHLHNLEILRVQNRCGVSQEGISKLLLVKKLDAWNNNKITNVNHLKYLEDLDASWNCGITQEGISELSLIKRLHTDKNNKISNNK